MGFVGIMWEFLNRCEIMGKRKIVFESPKPLADTSSSLQAAAWWRKQSYVHSAAVAGRYFCEFNTVGTATGDNC